MSLKLVKRGKSDNWYIRGTVRGVVVDESTGLRDRRSAEEVLALRSAEIVRQSVHGRRAVYTFADAALSYMEAGGERTHLAPIIRHFGTKLLAHIAQDEIDQCAAKLKPRAAPATLNRHIYTPIAAVLHHAARKRWCDRPVIQRPSEPKGRVRWITYEEAEQLIEAAGQLRPLVIFLLSTGCRIGEALALDWRDVDLSAAQVCFLDTKNGEDRGGYLHPRALAELANLPHRTGKVFRVHYGHAKKDGTTTPIGPGYADREGAGGGQVKTGWAAMLRRAKMENFTPHDCRHTWATWYYRHNRDIAGLMELGGWKTPQMVMRYTHVNTSHLAPAVNRIWGIPGDPEPAKPTNPLQQKAS